MIKKIVNKAVATKAAITTALYVGYTEAALAQFSGSGGTTKLTTFMQGILTLMPIAARIAGAAVFIGGLWSMYKHFKSQGRDGSVAAGVAGVIIGAALFFMGGLMKFGADVVGFEQTSNLPN